MARLLIADYSDGHYAGIHATKGKSFAVPHTSIEHTHCHGGGKMSTEATCTIALNENAHMTVKVSFPLAGKLGKDNLPVKFYERATDATKRIISFIYASEMWVMQAARLSANVNCGFIVKDDKDRAEIVLNVRGEKAYGQLAASSTHAIARAMQLGVGTIIQKECDEIADACAIEFAEEDKAAAKGTKAA